MGAIFETFNHGHNVLGLVDILTNFSFTTTKTEKTREFCYSVWLTVIHPPFKKEGLRDIGYSITT